MTDETQDAIFDAASYLARNRAGGEAALAGTQTASVDAVDTALESLLGARPDNSHDFQTLLGRAFTTEEVDGRTKIKYRRPSTAGAMMLTGGGVLTGAQASIVSRAGRARDEILDNLDPLVPLARTPDPDEVRDIRSLIRTVVDAIVEELGRPGGPTVIRVDRLLEELAGEGAIKDAPVVSLEKPGGLLGRLKDVFGMDRGEISSLDDERTYTSFIGIVGAVASLCSNWSSDRAYLNSLGGEPYLGTQLVQIERSLAVVGQAVEEARRALDRAEVEPNEREIPLEVTLNGGSTAAAPGRGKARASGEKATASVGAVLSWAEAFARRGQDRLRHGGQAGIDSFVTEAADLIRLIDALLNRIGSTGGLSGVGSLPVRRALTSLKVCVENAQTLAVPLKRKGRIALTRAELLSVAGTGSSDERYVLALYGDGFNDSTSVYLYDSVNKEIKQDWCEFVSESRIDVGLRRTSPVSLIKVENADGGEASLPMSPPYLLPPAAPPPPQLSLDRVLHVTSQATTRDPGNHTSKASVGPCEMLTLIGSGFDDETFVELRHGGREVTSRYEFSVLSDSVATVIYEPADVDQIVVTKRPNLRDEMPFSTTKAQPVTSGTSPTSKKNGGA